MLPVEKRAEAIADQGRGETQLAGGAFLVGVAACVLLQKAEVVGRAWLVSPRVLSVSIVWSCPIASCALVISLMILSQDGPDRNAGARLLAAHRLEQTWHSCAPIRKQPPGALHCASIARIRVGESTVLASRMER